MSDKSEIVIVSNRLPVHRVEQDGKAEWQTSPGGLVSAMTPILRGHPSTWIGWAGTPDWSPEPFEHGGGDGQDVCLIFDDQDRFRPDRVGERR